MGPGPETNTVEVSAAGIEGTVIFSAEIRRNEFDLSVPTGISLIHLPLRVTEVDGVPLTIESISDLYNTLGGADRVNVLLTRDPAAQQWRSYFGTRDKGAPGNIALTDDLGIIAITNSPATIRLRGDALGTEGRSSIRLHSGMNLVGLPLRDSRITRVSDLLSLEEIQGNVTVIVVSDNGEFKVVGRADDDGDISVSGGQSFVMIAREAASISIAGDAWTSFSGMATAPKMTVTSIEVGDATPVLAFSGSIVDEGKGYDNVGFRVAVKNLSTGKVVTTVTTNEDSLQSTSIGYRLAVVDIKSGRTAQVGDVLEVSAESSHPLIRVQPLRATQ